MSSEEFNDAKEDPSYRRWLRESPNGFVLNAGPDNTIGPRAKLHRAACWHVGGQGNDPANGAYWVTAWQPKVCFLTWVDVTGYPAKWAGGVLRNACGHCQPHGP